MPKHATAAVAVKRAATIAKARYPSLFQINTRVWLTDLARRLGWRERGQKAIRRSRGGVKAKATIRWRKNSHAGRQSMASQLRR